MSKLISTVKSQIREAILSSMGRAAANGDLPLAPAADFIIETANDPSHGDFASNAAMVNAKAFRLPPRKIAEIICENLILDGTYIDRAEVAGPGFLNFFASQKLFSGIVSEIETEKEQYGKSSYGKGKRVMVEFVSANPTGPMHMGNARGGAIGDCLASVLSAAGYYVEREFYVNDAGNQIDKFALSLDVRYRQIYLGEDAVQLPEDAYHGGDIADRAAEFAEINGDSYIDKPEEERRAALVAFALPRNIERMKTDLEKYRITYDTWFLESTLHQSGEVAAVVDLLTEKGLTYESEGAVWYKATEFGGEKDEVLIRANGNPTYFLADIAYHTNKFKTRGFDICIDVWGADHHGHIARLKGALDAVGLDGSKLDIVLIQLVKLVRDGEIVRMSKRTGKAIQLVDLLDEVPVDAARFFFNMRESTSQMDFDLDLAVSEDSQNPVYYCQYAYARICSIFRKAEERGIIFTPANDARLGLLTHPAELELIRYLAQFTEEIVSAAREYNPSRITRYAIELAAQFHRFYGKCRVIDDSAELTSARLTLCDAARTVMKNALTILKISAPERMEVLI
ncbi:MAG: arginine--tRNA ligase [Oscillospiraceae bacterium]|jgi:arginyl-tRNA synthetase|nr:arginine--tRNA ligase [Oscillospiraceae bacterium]